jgi:RNA polymerase sigma-70 factor (ECF subfamily)
MQSKNLPGFVIPTGCWRDYSHVDDMRSWPEAGLEPATLPGDASAEVISDDRVEGARSQHPSDPHARSFEVFYRREMPRLVALARALSGSSAADDIAQEAMLAAFRRWSEVAAYENPEAWVRRVCANHATSLLRRRGAETRAVLRLASQPSPDTELDERHEAFWAEVRRLPRRQAQAAALRYVYDLSVADIAATMACSEGSVKVHLTRARAALADRLEKEATE